jgi:hypothetical protein
VRPTLGLSAIGWCYPIGLREPYALGRSVITLDTVKARIAVVDRHADDNYLSPSNRQSLNYFDAEILFLALARHVPL